jgi:hypothetical protein
METYEIKTKNNMKLVVPKLIDEKGVTFRSTCQECKTLGRRKGTAKVLDVMAAEVQKNIIKKNGELHKAYVTYTAVVASCDDHWRNLTKAEKKELALLVGNGNVIQDGRHYFVKCNVFELKTVRNRFKKRSGPSRNFKTVYSTKTSEVFVERLWVRADFIDEYCAEMASAGRIVRPMTE